MKSILTFALSIGISAWAVHAGAESHGQHQGHTKASEDCMEMHKMDKGKMDMTDPAMKAMHERCMQHMHGKGSESGAGGHDHSTGKPDTDAAQPEHQHQHDKSGN